MDDVLKTSLVDLEVRCPVADVVLWKDTLVRVPFCDDEEEEATALDSSSRRSTSESDGAFK